MNVETGRRLLLLLQEMQGRAYTPFVTWSHRLRVAICVPVSTVQFR
jgi:hypothetical protein